MALLYALLITIAAVSIVWAVGQQDGVGGPGGGRDRQGQVEPSADDIEIRPGHVCGFAELPSRCSARLRASLDGG